MPIFEKMRFEGTLSGHGNSISIGFDVGVDDLGALQIDLDRIPFSREAYALYASKKSGTSIDFIRIEGRSSAGCEFRSNSFYIRKFSHGSQSGRELNYQGECYDAELDLSPTELKKPRREARVWIVRQLRTFYRISHETPLGFVVIGGPSQVREAQEPNGFLALHRSENDSNEDWWAESEMFLTHIARVLSFACDTYLQPVLEERYRPAGCTVRLFRHGRASSPFMAPFHELNMEPIFIRACDSYFTRHSCVQELDAAIRWLAAPVVYDESRLVNAMSALENVLDRCGLKEVGTFMEPGAFRIVARLVREVLREHGAPEGMASKIFDLNRPSLKKKILTLLEARSIVVSDFPENWLADVIRQRNFIVHTGVSMERGEQEPRTWDHTVWAREIITRIILERLDFKGAYRSWLHHDEQYRFPECVSMQEWAQRPHD